MANQTVKFLCLHNTGNSLTKNSGLSRKEAASALSAQCFDEMSGAKRAGRMRRMNDRFVSTMLAHHPAKETKITKVR